MCEFIYASEFGCFGSESIFPDGTMMPLVHAQTCLFKKQRKLDPSKISYSTVDVYHTIHKMLE